MRIKNQINNIITAVFMLLLLFPIDGYCQESEHKFESEDLNEEFQSPLIIHNQTTDVTGKNELEFSFMQRFGNIINDADLFGLYSSANLRLGLDYGIVKGVSIGIGATAVKSIFDMNAKIKLMSQDNTKGIPVTVVFFGEASRSGMSQDNFVNQSGEYNSLNRLSYFSELMVSRKLNKQFSLQGALTFSYFNLIEETNKNSNIGLSVLGSYKIYHQTSLVFDFDYPLTHPEINPSKPNLGIGLAFAGKNNMLQLFITTTNAIVNSEFRVFNQNDFMKNDFLIGFNISHKWALNK